jgi:DNA repair photolyase
VNETHAKSILRVHRKVDSWFISRYGLNLYRGCAHACAYCDGRSETYQAPEDFDNNIEVKVNALEVLEREFERLVKRKASGARADGSQPLLFDESALQPKCAAPVSAGARGTPTSVPSDSHETHAIHAPGDPPASVPIGACGSQISGFLTLGGGVSDQYQPLEEKYELARGVLKLCLRFRLPVHILTKSTLVLRDIDLLREINEQTRALISVSISTLDPTIAAVAEPGAPPPQERLAMFKEFRAAGIACGVYVLPVLPYLSDTPAAIEASIAGCAHAGARFIIFGGLTLKPGRQTKHYLACLAHNFSAISEQTCALFRNADRYGMPNTPEARARWRAAQQAATAAIQRHGLARRIPPELLLCTQGGAPIVDADDMKSICKMDEHF